MKHFLSMFYLNIVKKKILKIKMDDLARIINETRLAVSKTLNKMQEDGWIELHRGEIIIPRLEDLIG